MLHTIDPKSLTPEVFAVFGTRNALLTAGTPEHLNTMTIGWCQLGRLWNRPVCTVYVRPERYTYSFTEAQNTFSVAVLPGECREIIQLCGTQSGRDVDKVREYGLTVCTGAENTPYFAESELVLICRKLYRQDLDPAGVVDSGVIGPFYGEGDGWHRMYVGEVLEAYTR